MKKLAVFFVVILTILVVGSSYFQIHSFADLDKKLSYSFCDNPIHYKIGTVDPKFSLSSKEFAQDVFEAAQVWSKADSRQLFVYDPDGKLTISLVYDQRQQLNSQIRSLESELKQNRANLDPQIVAFEAKEADFKNQVTALNQQIEYWNQKGGAPPEEYDKLIQKQQQLKRQVEELNATARSLNLSATSYNNEVSKLNQTIDLFNEELSLRPEEGLYDPKEAKVEIYFSISRAELIHTLAHELGHVLGIDHNRDKRSIMYPYTTRNTTLSKEDLASLQRVCKRYSLAEAVQAYLQRAALNLKLILRSYNFII